MRSKTRSEADRRGDVCLADALLAGDPAAPRLAWQRLSPLVQRILAGYFAGSADAQDLCQEVFLRFFARLGELRNPRALRSFLIGICLGVAQNERRRVHVRRVIGLARTDQMPDYAIGPFDVEARQALGRLRDILAGVSATDRALFTVRHIDQMEVSEIAVARGWSLTKAKRHVKRVSRRVGMQLRREPALAAYARATGG